MKTLIKMLKRTGLIILMALFVQQIGWTQQVLTTVLLKNRDKADSYIKVENGALTVGPLKSDEQSGLWDVEDAGDNHYRLKNNLAGNQYLHIKQGQLLLSAVPATDESSHWMRVKVDGTDNYRLENRGNSGQFLHFANGPTVDNVSSGNKGAHWGLYDKSTLADAVMGDEVPLEDPGHLITPEITQINDIFDGDNLRGFSWDGGNYALYSLKNGNEFDLFLREFDGKKFGKIIESDAFLKNIPDHPDLMRGWCMNNLSEDDDKRKFSVVFFHEGLSKSIVIVSKGGKSEPDSLHLSESDNIRGWHWDGANTASYLLYEKSEDVNYLVTQPFDGEKFGVVNSMIIFSYGDNLRSWNMTKKDPTNSAKRTYCYATVDDGETNFHVVKGSKMAFDRTGWGYSHATSGSFIDQGKGAIVMEEVTDSREFNLLGTGQTAKIYLSFLPKLFIDDNGSQYLTIKAAGTYVDVATDDKMAYDVNNHRGWFLEKVKIEMESQEDDNNVVVGANVDVESNVETGTVTATYGSSIGAGGSKDGPSVNGSISGSQSWTGTIQGYKAFTPSVGGSHNNAVSQIVEMRAVKDSDGTLRTYDPEDKGSSTKVDFATTMEYLFTGNSTLYGLTDNAKGKGGGLRPPYLALWKVKNKDEQFIIKATITVTLANIWGTYHNLHSTTRDYSFTILIDINKWDDYVSN
ncbi:MAG: hypothetical protein DWQ02_07350 [Bacteroidetes bacterium]|nr:MAG: hypothetical protein DWQ02_07350 [Bacteroidota bacterium]